MSPALLSIADAAAYLGVSRDTVERLRRSDMDFAATFVRIGTLVRVRRADLDRWIESRPAGWSSRGGRRERSVA